ncbi:restriction endonuclease subunit S, partial [Natronomonas sp. F2-12]
PPHSSRKDVSISHCHQAVLRLAKDACFDFALPPLPEQRKIASVLYNVDQAIQKTKEIIDQAGQLRQATEQDLFREGYSNHDKIEERRLVEFPADWDFEQLSEHTIESAFGPRYDSEKYDENGGIATLRTTDLDRRGNITRETMPRADLDINEFQKHLLKKGDLVVSRSGAYSGITTTWDGHEIPTIPGAYMIRFRLENTLNPEYLRYYFNSNVGRSRINRRKKGSGQQNIAGSDLLNMRIPIPSKEEQEKIVEVVNSIESQILFNKDYCERLECLKRGLMQDLLSGTVRTTDTNIEIPEEVAQYG